MLKRILGSFPVFASKAKLGNLKTLSGKSYTDESWESPSTLDLASFQEGFTSTSDCKDIKIEPEALNGILNYLSNGIAYLYDKGIPEYSLNTYSRGAVVVYEGSIYISKSDRNRHHPSQSLFWDKLEPSNTQAKSDNAALGTIITVPLSYNKDGYIDYIEGTKFNRTVYPELYKVLGTDTFGTTSDSIEQLPIGTVLNYLGSDIPDGWVEWKYKAGNLAMYPQLVQTLYGIMLSLPIGSEDRMLYEDAIARKTFPNIGDVFLRGGSTTVTVGSVNEASMPQFSFNMLPVVLDPSNTLNPMGITRCKLEEQISPISGVNTQDSVLDSSVVLVGQRAENYFDIKPKQVNVTLGSAIPNTYSTELAPKHLNTRLIVKAKNVHVGVPSTHKQLIKAF